MKNDMKAAVSPMEMDVRIFPYRGDGPVAAIASVTLNGCFAVRDVRIMEGEKHTGRAGQDAAQQEGKG